jgi:hypothetical protein
MTFLKLHDWVAITAMKMNTLVEYLFIFENILRIVRSHTHPWGCVVAEIE